MFELSVAFKYLTPRWRQLSVSIISMVSILVIALVVWLIVVFFSVTHGLEKSWIQKLTALTAPVRITPTEAYYHSYYYLADTISIASDYTAKDIGEKLRAPTTDPYDSSQDEEIPSKWKKPIRNSDGSLKDLVKTAYQIANSLPGISGLSARDFEMAVANLRIDLIRSHPENDQSETNQNSLMQATYLGTFDPTNPAMQQVLMPIRASDKENLVRALSEMKNATDITNLSELIVHLDTLPDGSQNIVVPSDTLLGEGILVPKGFQDVGTFIGDRGSISYYSPTTSSIQEQRIPVYVAGFYDPGIISMGGKYVLANTGIINLIHASHRQETSTISNGINLRFDNLEDTDKVKELLQKAFVEAGIAPYFHIETYREFDFTKDLIQQLRSEKNLWSLLAIVIIIVACSNIISMLIILVNDKKMEIGILRSMGASSASIAFIFGVCGMVMGALGSIIGTLVAVATLKNLQTLVDFIGKMQGYEMFNPLFYGNTLPNEVSLEALTFVVMTTSCISLLAGVVPAIKAGLVRPSIILKSG